MSAVGALERLAERARALEPRAGATAVIAIEGRSGAGKTTLAGELAAALDAPTVALEDLYGDWDGLEAGVARLLSAVLSPIAAGRAARVPRYDWHARAWADPWLLAVPPRLVVEGVGVGARAVAPYTDLLVWLELPTARRRERAIARDGAIYRPHWRRWAALEERFYERERPWDRADVVLDGAAL